MKYRRRLTCAAVWFGLSTSSVAALAAEHRGSVELVQPDSENETISPEGRTIRYMLGAKKPDAKKSATPAVEKKSAPSEKSAPITFRAPKSTPPPPQPSAAERRFDRLQKRSRGFWVRLKDPRTGNVQLSWRQPASPNSAGQATISSSTPTLASPAVTFERVDVGSTLRITQPLQAGQVFQVNRGGGSNLTLQGNPIPNGRTLDVNRYMPIDSIGNNVYLGSYQPIFYGSQARADGTVIPTHVAFVLPGRNIPLPIEAAPPLPAAPAPAPPSAPAPAMGPAARFLASAPTALIGAQRELDNIAARLKEERVTLANDPKNEFAPTNIERLTQAEADLRAATQGLIRASLTAQPEEAAAAVEALEAATAMAASARVPFAKDGADPEKNRSPKRERRNRRNRSRFNSR